MAEDSILDEIEKYINAEKMDSKMIDAECKAKASIGRKMAYCRKILGFTQKEMADIFEVAPKELSDYEKDVMPPPLLLLFLYAKYFEIPMEDFVDDFVSMKEFTVNYCIFHFIKFKVVYKFIHKI